MVYGAYLETLTSRPHHGDRVFPRAAAAALAARAADGATVGEVSGGPGTGWWWAGRAVDLAALAVTACAFDRRLRRDMAWAAIVLPVGAFLGPALLRVLGGTELWSESPAALRAAAFGARLDGVPARSLGLLARLGGEGDRADPTSRRLARASLALAQAAVAVGLERQVAASVLLPADPVARALALRYGGRIQAGRGRPPRPA